MFGNAPRAMRSSGLRAGRAAPHPACLAAPCCGAGPIGGKTVLLGNRHRRLLRRPLPASAARREWKNATPALDSRSRPRVLPRRLSMRWCCHLHLGLTTWRPAGAALGRGEPPQLLLPTRALRGRLRELEPRAPAALPATALSFIPELPGLLKRHPVGWKSSTAEHRGSLPRAARALPHFRRASPPGSTRGRRSAARAAVCCAPTLDSQPAWVPVPW